MTSKKMNYISIGNENEDENDNFKYIPIVVSLNYLKSQTEGSLKTLGNCLNSYCSDIDTFLDDDKNKGYIVSVNKIIVNSVCKTIEDLISSFNLTLMDELKHIGIQYEPVVGDFEYQTRGSFTVDFKIMYEEYFISICNSCDKISNCINDNIFGDIDKIYTELYNNLSNMGKYVVELKTRYI